MVRQLGRRSGVAPSKGGKRKAWRRRSAAGPDCAPPGVLRRLKIKLHTKLRPELRSTQVHSHPPAEITPGTGGSILDLFGALSAYATGHTLSTTDIDTAISDALSEKHGSPNPDRRP